MKTAYGKLAALAFVLIVGILLFAPMRNGTEDYLYAYPRSIRMNRGDTYTIAYRLDADVTQAVSYSSANERIAAVSEDGLVTALAPGKTQIRLDAENGARTMVSIEVAGKARPTLVLNTGALNMEKGQVTGLRAIFSEDAESTLVEWSSQDETIAQVDAVGRVSAVGGGSTRVTARSAGGLTASAKVNVHVTGTAMRITPEEVTLGQGTMARLGAYYFPSDTTDSISRWTTSDESVLRVQEDGSIIAAGTGQAVVSVFSEEGLTTSTIVRVESAAEDFLVSPAAATIERGSKLTLAPRFLNEQGQVEEQSAGHYITWASSNPDIATVEDGVVSALRSGQTRITASADGKVAICNLKVQVLVHEIRLNHSEVYLLREETVNPIQLEAELIPSDPDNPHITFMSNNDLVATVNQKGLVTPVGCYGTAKITVRAESGAEASFIVNVVPTLPEGYVREE